jgi:ABC-type antimicrobial peptide transport system permease subunit
MISLGLAINERFAQEIDNMGDVTIVTVYNFSPPSENSAASVRAASLDDNAVTKISKIPGVRAATALINLNLMFKSGQYIMPYCTVYGISPGAMEAMGYAAAEGRLLEPGDKENVVFGAKAELQFYKNNDYTYYSERLEQDRMGESVETLVDVLYDRITMSYDYRFIYGNQSEEENPESTPVKAFNIKSVGILEERDYQTDQSVFMDITAARKLMEDQRKAEQSQSQQYGYFSGSQNAQRQGYDTVKVKCVDLNMVRSVSDEINKMGFYAEFPTSNLDSLQSMTTGMQAMLGAIGAVSMLVAAIGIANTMVMSIYERTREIGVMKVIGAALSDIRKLFLLEAALIGITGGCTGVLLSLGISYLLNNAKLGIFDAFFSGLGGETGVISLVTPSLCGIAILFSAVIGLFSGYFPARRAMRLSALTAIKTDS